MNPFTQAGSLITQTVFDLYLLVIVLRLILQYFRISFANQIAQFTYKLTEPVVSHFRHIIPRTRLFDLPLSVFLFLCICIKFILLGLLMGSVNVNPWTLSVLAVAEVLRIGLNVFFYALLLSVILSWVNPGLHSPLTNILYRLTEPLLAPFRRVLPLIAGIDLSILFAMMGIKLMEIFLLGYLLRLAL